MYFTQNEFRLISTAKISSNWCEYTSLQIKQYISFVKKIINMWQMQQNLFTYNESNAVAFNCL